MRIRLLGLALGILSLPTVASADAHRWEWYVGGSGGEGASTLKGLNFSVAVTGQKHGGWKKVGFVADFSTEVGSHGDVPVTQFAYVFGARVMPVSFKHVKLFGQLMGGRVHHNDGAPKPTDNSLAAGFGLDIVTDTDVNGHSFGYRLQVDHFSRSGTREDFWRFSTGFVYRYGKAK